MPFRRTSLMFVSVPCGLVFAILSVPHGIAQSAQDKAWTLVEAPRSNATPEKR